MIKRFALIVSILFTVVASAQEGTSSPYSFYGIGLTTFKGTVENRSMGGLSFYTDSIHLNLRNPAAYGKLGLTAYAVGGTYSGISTKTSSEKESSSVTSLDYLAIGIPAGKFGFGFGLRPYTSVGYHLLNQDEGENKAGRYSGSGGLNQVYLSAGYEITKNLYIGVDANYNFGNIENKNLNVRKDIQFGTREINKSTLSGFNFNFGLNYQQMVSKNLEWMASAMYSPTSDLKSKNSRNLASVTFLNTGQELVAESRNIPVDDTEMTLASQYTFGTGIGQPTKWFAGVEYTLKEASSYSNRSFELQNASYSDAATYRVGGFYIPNANSLTSYFSRVVYRAGFRMEETGLRLEGEDINEFGISFGVGLPAGEWFSNINLGAEYGKRGTTNAGLIEENFFKISIGLSLNDRWFRQRKFE